MTHSASITFTTQGLGTVTVGDTTQSLAPDGWSLPHTAEVALQDHTGNPSWQPSQQPDIGTLVTALDDPDRRTSGSASPSTITPLPPDACSSTPDENRSPLPPPPDDVSRQPRKSSPTCPGTWKACCRASSASD